MLLLFTKSNIFYRKKSQGSMNYEVTSKNIEGKSVKSALEDSLWQHKFSHKIGFFFQFSKFIDFWFSLIPFLARSFLSREFFYILYQIFFSCVNTEYHFYVKVCEQIYSKRLLMRIMERIHLIYYRVYRIPVQKSITSKSLYNL